MLTIPPPPTLFWLAGPAVFCHPAEVQGEPGDAGRVEDDAGDAAARVCGGVAGHGAEIQRDRAPIFSMPPPLSADPPVIVTRVSDRFPPGLATSGRQVPGQNRKRAPRHGDATQPGHHHPAAGRSRQHRRRQPPPRPRPATHALAASGSVNDFAVSRLWTQDIWRMNMPAARCVTSHILWGILDA
jgi:hypothetical protein